MQRTLLHLDYLIDIVHRECQQHHTILLVGLSQLMWGHGAAGITTVVEEGAVEVEAVEVVISCDLQAVNLLLFRPCLVWLYGQLSEISMFIAQLEWLGVRETKWSRQMFTLSTCVLAHYVAPDVATYWESALDLVPCTETLCGHFGLTWLHHCVLYSAHYLFVRHQVILSYIQRCGCSRHQHTRFT